MSRPTLTITGKAARRAIVRGVNAVYEPVAKTLGPQGRNVLLYRTYNRGPRITNDGVTVSECIDPIDVYEKIAAQAFKEGAKKTNERVGDGTTTTTVLAGYLLNHVDAILSEHESSIVSTSKTPGVMSIRKDIFTQAKIVKDRVRALAQKVNDLETLEKIGIISVEDEELGKKIAAISWQLGPDGHIDVVEGFKGEIETDVITGMRFPAKVGHRAFVTNPARYEMVIDDSHILVTDYPMNDPRLIAEVIKNTALTKIVILAPSFSKNVLDNIAIAFKNGVHIFPVTTPALRTEQYEDIAVYVGAKFVSKAKNQRVEKTIMSELGYFDKMIVKDTEAKEDAVITGGRGSKRLATARKSEDGTIIDSELQSPVDERVAMLKSQITEQKNEMFRKMFERRIASLSSGVGVIRVGGATQAESLYQKLKIEDAVYACRAALRGGYVIGAGLCLQQISEELGEDNILYKTLREPHQRIQDNAGNSLEINTDKVIDPADVVYFAVEHATSLIANLITVEVIIPEKPEIDQGDALCIVAESIDKFTRRYAEHHGLVKEGEDEVERDMLQRQEELELSDHD